MIDRYVFVRDEGADGEPVKTALEQARQKAEEVMGRGASVLHLGSSGLGLNWNFTAEERDEFLNRLDSALQRIAKRYDVSYKEPSDK